MLLHNPETSESVLQKHDLLVLKEDTMTTKYKQEFADAQNSSVDEQTKLFLLAFAVEFSGKSEEVLVLVEDFKTYLKFSTDVALNQTDAHRLLERKGRAHTVCFSNLYNFAANSCAFNKYPLLCLLGHGIAHRSS